MCSRLPGFDSRLPAVISFKLPDCLFEIIEAGEISIHGRETQVSHIIEVAQRLEDCFPYFVARNFRFSARLEILLDLEAKLFEVLVFDIEILACLPHAIDDLGTAERFAAAIMLDNLQFDCFERCKPGTASWALATPRDGQAIIAPDGPNDFGVVVLAERTIHTFERSAQSSAISPFWHTDNLPHLQRQAGEVIDLANRLERCSYIAASRR